jgi:hypothetical protein
VRGEKGIPFASKPSPTPGGALNPPGQQEKEGKERNARNSFKEYQPRWGVESCGSLYIIQTEKIAPLWVPKRKYIVNQYSK